MLGFLLFSCVVLQPNEITNLISITADFMRSASQALHSALCNTSPTFNRDYQIKLSWQTDSARSGTESISHFHVRLLDYSRT